MIVLNFGTKFLLRRGECKTREIPISLHMHVSDCDRTEFRDEIPFKEGRM